MLLSDKGDLPDGLKHAAHASNEADLVFEDLTAVALGSSLLSLLILLGLLLFEQGVDVFAVQTLTLSELIRSALLHKVLHHVSDLLHEEGYGPLEEVHALGQVEWVLHILVLLDVHFVVFNQNHCALVVVFSAVIWRAKDCDHGGESLVAAPSVHLVAINLDLMSPDDGDKVVGAEDLLDGVEAEFDGALTLGVRTEAHLSGVTVVHRV